MVDFSRIPTRHDAINLRLEQWAKWVSVRPQAWKVQPMFRQYRSHSWQWHEPEIKVELNTIECCETEKLVSQLHEKHRAAVYGCGRPFKAVAADLDMTSSELSRKLGDNPNDPVHFPLHMLPDLIRATGDRRPVYWLIETFLEDQDTKRHRAVAQLADMLPQLQALVKAATSAPAEATLRAVA